MARRTGQPADAAGVEERLVDREPLDPRRRVLEDAVDLLARLGVGRHPRLDHDRGRAEPAGAADAHRRADAVRLRLVASREHHPRADDHRATAQARVVALLDRREEGVEIRVQDRGLARHEHMFAGNARSRNAFGLSMARTWSAELELKGAGGEPVDLRRTIASHGVADLPPNEIDADASDADDDARAAAGRGDGPRLRRAARASRASRATAPQGGRARRSPAHAAPRRRPVGASTRSAASRPGARLGRRRRGPAAAQPDRLRGRGQDDLHHELRLVGDGADDDRARRPPRRRGARRPPRLPHARRRWPRPTRPSTATSSARATAARTSARSRRASPRAGSTSRRSTTPSSATTRSPNGCSRSPGCGPYATAHMMMLLGRYSRLMLDSWTRPTVRAPARPQGRRPDDRAALPPLPRLRGPRVLALPDARLGGDAGARCLPLVSQAAGLPLW